MSDPQETLRVAQQLDKRAKRQADAKALRIAGGAWERKPPRLMRTWSDFLEVDRTRRVPILVPRAVGEPIGLSGVYFVQWNAYIKIGSAHNVELRRKMLQDAIPEGDVVGLAWIPVFVPLRYYLPCEYEAKVHYWFRSLRVRGEWFRDVPRLRRFMDQFGYAWPPAPRPRR